MSDYKPIISCEDVIYVATHYGNGSLQKIIKAYKNRDVGIHVRGSEHVRDISEVLYTGNVRNDECLDDNHKLSSATQKIIHPGLYGLGYFLGWVSEFVSKFKPEPQQNLYGLERQR